MLSISVNTYQQAPLDQEKPMLIFCSDDEAAYQHLKTATKQSHTLIKKHVMLTAVQDTALGIVRTKAREAADKLDAPVVITESALLMDAMGGFFPGPYIHQFMKQPNALQKLVDIASKTNCTRALDQFVVGYCPGRGFEPVAFQCSTEGVIDSSDASIHSGNSLVRDDDDDSFEGDCATAYDPVTAILDEHNPRIRGNDWRSVFRADPRSESKPTSSMARAIDSLLHYLQQ